MADKKISQLPQGVINSNSIFPLLSNGVTSQVSYDDMATAFSSSGGSGSQDFQETLENGFTTDIPFYHETSDGITVQSGIIERDGEAFPLNGINMDYSSQVAGAFVRIGFSTGEGPVIVIETNYIGGEELVDTISTNYYLPHSQDGGSNQVITDKDLSTGNFTSEISSRATEVPSSGNTWIQDFYWTRVGNTVSCTAEISVQINQDVSSNGTWVEFTLPFPQSNSQSRTNVGNGVLAGGGVNGIYTSAFIQMEDTTHAKVRFYGKSGDTSSSYQGEIHFTYLTE